MGNATFRSIANPPQDLRVYFQADLPKFIIGPKIGNGKFMKTYSMKVDNAPFPIVVKVYMRTSDDEQYINQISLRLSHLWKVISFARYPNLLPYECWIKSSIRMKPTGVPVYLLRQFISANLHDRLSTRPFLNETEKLWIVFQLFKCLEILNSHNIVHGDIKPENIMITSWNWIILTDFAPFKPVYIPDDDPTDFQYFFETMGRGRCYIAPERFMKKQVGISRPAGEEFGFDVKDENGSMKKSKLTMTSEMDIFSLGCCMAEIFLDGETLLDLPAMLKYNSNSANLERLDQDESPVKGAIQRINNPMIRKAVVDMTQRNPEKRLTALEYRLLLQGGVNDVSDDISSPIAAFPLYFEKFLYPLFLRLHFEGITPDARVGIICEVYANIVLQLSGEADSLGSNYFCSAMKDIFVSANDEKTCTDNESIRNVDEVIQAARSRKSFPFKAELLSPSPSKESKKKETIDRISSQEAISSIESNSELEISELIKTCKEFIKDVEDSKTKRFEEGLDDIKDLLLTSEAKAFLKASVTSKLLQPWGLAKTCDEFLIIIQVIISQFRNLKHPQSRIVSLLLLIRLGIRCSDSIILSKILPILIHSLEDTNAVVRSMGINAIRTLLRNIQTISSFETNIFNNYIFPALSKLSKDNEMIVRITFAESIGILAETSKRFLDLSHLVTQNKIIQDYHNNLMHEEKGEDEVIGNQIKESRENILAVDFNYDKKLKLLHEQISRWIRDLVLDSNNSSSSASNDLRSGSGLSSNLSLVKRALLVDLMRLCSFFGQESTMDMLLTQLLTFLNDQDWELRFDFCDKIASVCLFLGSTVTSECVLPCIENALFDIEEKVIAKAFECLVQLVGSQLLSNSALVDLIDIILPLLFHPSNDIRNSLIDLLVIISKVFGTVYSSIYLYPKLYPNYITIDLQYILFSENLTVDLLRYSLKSPISRMKFRQGLLQRQQVYNISTSQMNNITTIKDSLTSPEEEVKIALLTKYLDRAAQEISTKIKQWRNGNNSNILLSSSTPGSLSSSNSLNRYAMAVMGNDDDNLAIFESILAPIPSSQTPDNLLQVVQVPHQKYGQAYFPVIPEKARQDNIENLHLNKSTTKVSYLFGIISKQTGMLRNLQATIIQEQYQGGDVNAITTSSDHPTALAAADSIFANSSNPNIIVPSSLLNPVDSQTSIHKAHAALELSMLIKRIKALHIPPVPPDFGVLRQPDEKKFNNYLEVLDLSSSLDGISRSSWKPKENVLAMSLLEHKRSVNRLAVSPDQSFFISASSDQTAKVWQIRGIDRIAFPRSSLTYSQHKGALTDITTIENSHSVATASEDGSVHVWRVDVVANSTLTSINDNLGFDDVPIATLRQPGLTVGGYSTIRQLNESEGSIVSLQHFNGDMSSCLIYASQKGIVHGWDLRMSQESFQYTLRPELGYPTCSTVSSDRSWICIGTNKGFVALWDMRYNVMSCLWRHSSHVPIHRLACSKYMPSSSSVLGGSYLIAATGNNETSIWSIPDGGECIKCFRSIDVNENFISPNDYNNGLDNLPSLDPINFNTRHYNPVVPIISPFTMNSNCTSSNIGSVRSIIGRISQSSESYLITGGTDRHIRFWDFISPLKCYSIASPDSLQKPSFDAPEIYDGKLFVSYDMNCPSSKAILQSQIPTKEGLGLTLPPQNFKVSCLRQVKCI